VPVQADMRWKTEMKVEGGAPGGRPGRPTGGAGGGQAPVISMLTAVKEGAQRKESSIQVGPVSMNDVTITLCDKKQRLRLDDKLKIYAVLPMDADDTLANPMAGMMGAIRGALPPGVKIPGLPGEAPAGEPQTGKIVSTVTAEDLGEDTVAEVKTRHWMLTMQNEMSGCAGNGTRTMKMEAWTANFDEPLFCPDAELSNPVRDYQRRANPNPQCKITFEMRGEGMEAYGKIFRGLVLRLKMYADAASDKPVMTQEVTMLTRAKQDDALFAAPADYKQVTPEEFEQMRAQAMMRQMMGGR